MADGDTLAVVVVCHDSAETVGATLDAVRSQLRPGDELVVVDNVSRDGTLEVVRAAAPEASIVETGANLGFAGGVNAGAAAARGDLLLLLNPDSVPQPGCLEALRAAAAARPGWGAWQALVTMDGGTSVNTAGNVAHFLGLGWAGRLGQPVGDVPPELAEVGFASGAALVVRRRAWDAVGGFDPRYFMYVEDLDLSLRLRLAGWDIGVVPPAHVDHDYDFVKGDYKWFYLERNRWWTVLGTYPGALLALVLPALLAAEAGLLAVAWRGGWLGAKLRAQAAVVRELRAILRRRRAIQAQRAIAARTFADALASTLDSPILAGAAAIPGLSAGLNLYFAVVRRLLGAAARRPR